MTTTNEFKGQRGGDPSRMPPMVDIHWSCTVCGKPDVLQTRRPQHTITPEHCSARCKDLQHEAYARELIQQRFNKCLPSADLLRIGVFSSIAKYGRLLESAEKNRNSVVLTKAKCPHCRISVEIYRYSTEKQSNRPTFCSANCAQSAKAKMPKGEICANPQKKKFDTEADALIAVAKANSELVTEGEEPMVAYKCICSQFHFGHESKAIAEDNALASRNAIKNLLKEIMA